MLGFNSLCVHRCVQRVCARRHATPLFVAMISVTMLAACTAAHEDSSLTAPDPYDPRWACDRPVTCASEAESTVHRAYLLTDLGVDHFEGRSSATPYGFDLDCRDSDGDDGTACYRTDGDEGVDNQFGPLATALGGLAPAYDIVDRTADAIEAETINLVMEVAGPVGDGPITITFGRASAVVRLEATEGTSGDATEDRRAIRRSEMVIIATLCGQRVGDAVFLSGSRLAIPIDIGIGEIPVELAGVVASGRESGAGLDLMIGGSTDGVALADLIADLAGSSVPRGIFTEIATALSDSGPDCDRLSTGWALHAEPVVMAE